MEAYEYKAILYVSYDSYPHSSDVEDLNEHFKEGW